MSEDRSDERNERNERNDDREVLSLRRRIDDLESRLAVTETHRSYLVALHETALSLMSKLELDELLDAILRVAAELLGTRHGFLQMLAEDGAHMRVRNAIGAFGPSVGQPEKRGEDLTGRVWETKRCVIVDDYDRWEGNTGRMQKGLVGSVMGVPLLRRGEVIGVLGLAHAEPDQRFPPEAEEMMATFAQLASLAMDNALKVETIEKQARVIHELEAPIIEVWGKVLALPLLGVVDSRRAAGVMDRLLTAIVETQAEFAILDLTGVDVVDTGTANHIWSIIRAARLLGAEGIITGIRPTVATTMVNLGVDLSSVVTRARLRDGLSYCMQRQGKTGASRPS